MNLESIIKVKQRIVDETFTTLSIPHSFYTQEDMSGGVARINQYLAENHKYKVGVAFSFPNTKGIAMAVIVVSPSSNLTVIQLELEEKITDLFNDCGLGSEKIASFTYRLSFYFHSVGENEMAILYQECPAFVLSLHNKLSFSHQIEWEKPEMVYYGGEWGYLA